MDKTACLCFHKYTVFFLFSTLIDYDFFLDLTRILYDFLFFDADFI